MVHVCGWVVDGTRREPTTPSCGSRACHFPNEPATERATLTTKHNRTGQLSPRPTHNACRYKKRERVHTPCTSVASRNRPPSSWVDRSQEKHKQHRGDHGPCRSNGNSHHTGYWSGKGRNILRLPIRHQHDYRKMDAKKRNQSRNNMAREGHMAEAPGPTPTGGGHSPCEITYESTYLEMKWRIDWQT